MGIAVGVAAVLIVGILANAWGFRSLVSYIGSLIERIPLIKSIYGALRDFVQFFSASNERKFSKVVSVHLTPQCRLIGFVTREDAHVMVDERPGEEKLVAVYMPMSYQIGGYTMVLPESMTHPLDLSIEDAMRTRSHWRRLHVRRPTEQISPSPLHPSNRPVLFTSTVARHKY